MNTDLTFITNKKNHNLKERFEVLIKDTKLFDCLVGFFYTSGFHAIYKALEGTEKIRIIIGISTSRQTYDLLQIGDRVFYSGSQKNKKDIPFLKGKDISNYGINAPNNFLKYNYDKFLDDRVDILRFTSEFMETKPKIVYRQTASRIIAALDSDGYFLDKTVHLIVQKPKGQRLDLKYILAMLNSKLFRYLYTYISQEREGRTFAQVKTTYVKQLPVKNVEAEQKPFIHIVDKILGITENSKYLSSREGQDKVDEYESQLDEMVYKLYDLTKGEIKIVEGATNGEKADK